MESRRGLWIFVAVVLAVMCLCAVVITLVAVGALSNLGVDWSGIPAPGEERIARSFEVGVAPRLKIDNFAGGVTVRGGETGTIEVIAIKKGTRAQRDKIQVEMIEQEGGLVITTRKPSPLGIASVSLEIRTPPDTHLELHTGSGGLEVEGLSGPMVLDTGSGGIDVQDVTGELEARAGSGGIEVTGSRGPVSLETGSGGIDYEGVPQGECRFTTGSGGIELTLPSDLSVWVDLSTGSGSIDVDYEVEGEVSPRKVQGVIGSGDQGTIYAHTGSGSISLNRR